MMLYHLLLNLEEKKIYKSLLYTGVIPCRINTDFEIYKKYLHAISSKSEKRKTQIAYNVSVENKVSMKVVYRAIRKMREPVDSSVEIYIN